MMTWCHTAELIGTQNDKSTPITASDTIVGENCQSIFNKIPLVKEGLFDISEIEIQRTITKECFFFNTAPADGLALLCARISIGIRLVYFVFFRP